MAVDKRALSSQLNADPRVQQYVAQHQGVRGAAEIPAAMVRSWGYAIPDGYGVAVQGRMAHVYDKHDKWDTIIPAAGGALLGVGALGAAGVGPLAGSTAPAASSALGGVYTAPVAGVSEGVSQAASGVGFWGRLGGFLRGPLGSQLIETGGGLLANQIQANAANRATDAQTAGLREALDFEKQVYAEDKDFFRPWGDLGHQSAARLSEITGERRTPVSADSLWSGGQLPGQNRTAAPGVPSLSSMSASQTPAAAQALPSWADSGAPTSSTMPVREGRGTVRMQLSPNVIKDVPAAFVETWRARGAVVLEA